MGSDARRKQQRNFAFIEHHVSLCTVWSSHQPYMMGHTCKWHRSVQSNDCEPDADFPLLVCIIGLHMKPSSGLHHCTIGRLGF